jgi:prepilin-type N-terminal cleavage/methylation domain-containing protein
MRINQSGFTFIELIVVMGIAATLFGFITLNLVSTQRTTSVDSASDVLVSDMASQQTKAMMGAGVSSGTSYGIYFESDKYILFEGTTYIPSDIKNYAVVVGPGLTITNIKFPNNTLVFSARSGAVNNFSSGNDSISMQDIQGTKVETVKVNRYGVVIVEN